jgi:aminoglycoside phosphotransferase (APT) family kinase protein
VTTTTTDLTPLELRAVATALAGAGVELAGPLTCHAIAGGRSNLTFLLTDGACSWVLRTPPRVGRAPSAHDVAREFRVIAALAGTDVPVPVPVLLCENEGVLGGPFAVAGYVHGRSIQTRAQLDQLADVEVRRAVTHLVDVLATLHTVDPRAVGLGDLGRPDEYAARQHRRWAGQWQLIEPAFPFEARTAAAELVNSLAGKLPRQLRTSVVHGDYRLDNTLISSGADAAVLAVVDWELSTLGDPVADLALAMAYRHPAFDLVVGSPAAWTSDRLPSADGLATAYERTSATELVDLDRHLALAYLKIAVIAAGIDHRRRAGAGSGAGFDTAGDAVVPFLRAGIAALRGEW